MKRRKQWEFSKIVLAVVMGIYVLTTIVIGSYILCDNCSEQISEYLNFIGTPTSVAIGFYAWKAKNENMKKIKTSQRPTGDDENALE